MGRIIVTEFEVDDLGFLKEPGVPAEHVPCQIATATSG
jgi:hypothetical protein